MHYNLYLREGHWNLLISKGMADPIKSTLNLVIFVTSKVEASFSIWNCQSPSTEGLKALAENSSSTEQVSTKLTFPSAKRFMKLDSLHIWSELWWRPKKQTFGNVRWTAILVLPKESVNSFIFWSIIENGWISDLHLDPISESDTKTLNHILIFIPKVHL